MPKKKDKKTWKSFEVTKVKLNPEQAVLSCCSNHGTGGREMFTCHVAQCALTMSSVSS